jgi:hypothetical protein
MSARFPMLTPGNTQDHCPALADNGYDRHVPAGLLLISGINLVALND